MNENIKWVAAAVAVVGLSIGAVVYVSRNPKPPPVEELPVTKAPAPEPVAEEPAIKHPVPAAEMPEPLPKLAESDKPMQSALEDLIGKEFVQGYVVPKELISHIVVTVDNLPTEKVAERLRPVRPTPGRFAVDGTEEALVLSPSNYSRYESLVKLVSSVDTRNLIATYTRYYPLFQEAYEQLGHPPEYFNDRLIEVIDHLLATPDLQGPVALAQPNVQYEYADPALESKSAGQKVLMRMGSKNAKVVKDKLRELRVALVAQKPGT